MSDLISVIIPVYNVEKYLDKCLDSVVNQTYTNLEIILVDDGSTDGSGDICDGWAEKDSRIRVVHKNNGGLSDARNVGIELSNGRFLLFVDSDDYLETKMIFWMHRALCESKSEMSICKYLPVDDNGKVIEENNNRSFVSSVIHQNEAFVELTNNNISYIIACCKLYSRELLNDIKFPLGKLHEDEFVAHKIIGKCETIACVDDFLYYYVQRSGSITHKGYTYRSLDIVEALFDRTQYFFACGMNEFAVQSLYTATQNYLVRVRLVNAEFQELKKRKTELRKQYKKMFRKNIKEIKQFSTLSQFILFASFAINSSLASFSLLLIKVICKILNRR